MQWLIDWFAGLFTPAKTPQQEMQEQLEKGVADLRTARISLEEIRKLAEEERRGIICCKGDIAQLRHNIQNCLRLGNKEAAREQAQRLVEEEDELVQREQRLAKALADYDTHRTNIEAFQQELKIIEREAKTKQLNINLANFRSESASVALDLRNHNSELSQNEINAKARASVEDRVDPEKAYEDALKQDRIDELLKESK